MAEKVKHDVHITKSGLVIRNDPSLGLLVYSPYTGLIYAVTKLDSEACISWLDKKVNSPPSEAYLKSLGPGWVIPYEEAAYRIPNLLPFNDPTHWPVLPEPTRPITINWLITGMCPLNCLYCFAEDLMRNKRKEPNKSDIIRIIKNILSLNPIVVVLTGGDPLFSPYLEDVIKQLYKHVGIIVDSSAYNFTHNHLKIFKEYNVMLRISLDSEIPKINQLQRPVYFESKICNKSENNTTERALNALCECLNDGVNVTVQSVATKKTANDLVCFGDKLFRLGVKSWRVFKISPSKEKIEGFKMLVGTIRQQNKLYDHIFHELIINHNLRWNKQMALQVTQNENPNAVILVSPDGKFYTESNLKPGKILLDELNPNKPGISKLKSKINMSSHAERYLNITSLKYS